MLIIYILYLHTVTAEKLHDVIGHHNIRRESPLSNLQAVRSFVLHSLVIRVDLNTEILMNYTCIPY